MKTIKQSTNKVMQLACSILFLLSVTFILVAINAIITNLF